MKDRRAVLAPQQASELLTITLRAIGGPRPIEDRIRAAEEKLSKALKASVTFETGEVTWKLPSTPIEFVFNEKEMFGLKTAIVQAIRGSQTRSPADYGKKKYMLHPIAKELGILGLIQRETEVEGGGDLTIELDEESGEDNIQDGEEVNLDRGNGVPTEKTASSSTDK